MKDLQSHTKYTKLGDLIELSYGKGIPAIDRDENGLFPIYGANGVLGRTNKYLVNAEAIIVGRKGSAGEITRVSGKFWPSDVTYYVCGNDKIDIDYLYYLFKKINLKKFSSGIKPGINRNKVYEIKVLLPPINEQRVIVKKLKSIVGKIDSISEKFSRLNSIEKKLLVGYISDEKGFYREVKLHDYIEESNERVDNDWADKRKIGVSSENGITDLRYGTKSSFNNYKIVRKNNFVYNPMRINVGSIALYRDPNEAITSPDYVVFRVKDVISPNLLLQFLKSSFGLREIANNTHGAVRERLYFNSLANVKLPLSSVSKQHEAEKAFELFKKLKSNEFKINNSLHSLFHLVLSKTFKEEYP